MDRCFCERGLGIRRAVYGALNGGLTKEEIAAVFLRAVIDGGAPAAMRSIRVAREVHGEQGL